MSISNLATKNEHTVSCKCYTCTGTGLQFGNDVGVGIFSYNPFGAIHNFANCAVLNFPDIFPVPVDTQQVYVSKGGSDLNGSGNITNPYATISFALSSILDASVAKQYVINVGPGTYSQNLSLRPNISLMGEGTTSIDGNIDMNDPGWAGALKNICLIRDIIFDGIGSITIDYNSAGATDSQVVFFNCVFSGMAPSFIGLGTSFSIIDNSFFSTGLSVTGCTIALSNSTIISGNITVLSNTIAPCSFNATGSSLAGNLTATWTLADQNISMLFLGFPMVGPLTLDGTGVSLSSDANSIPITVNFLNSAPPINYLSNNLLSGLGDVNVGGATIGQILYFNGTKWINNTSIGNNALSGTPSFAIGTANNNAAMGGVAIGNSGIITSTALNSITLGDSCKADTTGLGSLAMGTSAVTRGFNSMCLNVGGTAESLFETVVGSFPLNVAGSFNTFVATDPIFRIGNGSSGGSPSDCFSILKNGNTTVTTLAGAGDRFVQADLNGLLSASNPVLTLDSNSFTPTPSSLVNLIGYSLVDARYLRIGDQVQVQVSFNVTIAALAVNFGFDLSLPVASVTPVGSGICTADNNQACGTGQIVGTNMRFVGTCFASLNVINISASWMYLVN